MIISTSFGGGMYVSNCYSSQSSLADAVTNANNAAITIFVSSGNDGYCDAVGSPACESGVVSVGAVYGADFGSYYPCVNSLSCATKTATTGCTSGYYSRDTTDISGSGGYSIDNYYASFGGTSAAASYAAGAGAVLQSAAKSATGSFLSTNELTDVLVSSGDLVTDPKASTVTKPKPRIDLQVAVGLLDSDGDGVCDSSDPFAADPYEWSDSDGDGIGNILDNCVNVANPSQLDTESDVIGDACDTLPETATYGAVIDAPHNNTRGVTCGDCHTYSLWWRYSPFIGQNSSGDQTDAICASCHGSGVGVVETHSSSAMGGMHRSALGIWSARCIDCHDVHRQAQLDWLGSDPDKLYLIQGTIDGGITIHNGQTTFNYTATTINPAWSDLALWGHKNRFLPGSGLVFVEDKMNAKNTFELIRADATTITLKGGIDPAVVNGTFGIMYGQFIRSTIKTSLSESREVKFYNPLDPEGGFTDSNTPVTGICQVCHENSVVWNNDGYLTDSPLHTGNGDTNCTDCHIPSKGFTPIVAAP